MKKFLSIFLAVVTLLSCAVSFAAAESTDAKTSAENRVYSEGEFDYTTLETPVLLTSFGQSADVSMLNALFKKLDEEVDIPSSRLPPPKKSRSIRRSSSLPA